MRTGFRYSLRNSAMSARNAFHTDERRGAGSGYGFNVGGGLIQNKASFFLRVNGNPSYNTPNSASPASTGTQIETLNHRIPRENLFVQRLVRLGGHARSDAAVQLQPATVRHQESGNRRIRRARAGVHEQRTTQHVPRAGGGAARPAVLHQHPAERRLERLGAASLFSRRRPCAFSTRRRSGGAQKAGGRHSRDVNFASDLDYVRGIHSVRIGTAIDANWYRSDESDNYLGTYTFESLEAFEAGRPRSYTRRIGDPERQLFQRAERALPAGRHPRSARPVGDAWRARRNPDAHQGRDGRARGSAATWAPFKNGKTTLRASWGMFYDWLPTNTYEQTIRIDGFRQQEINIANPTYPEPPLDDRGRGAGGSLSAGSRAEASEELARQRRRRLRVLAAHSRQCHLSLRARTRACCAGLNLNAPVNGVRPSPQFGNVIQVVGDGRMRQHVWNFGGQTNPPQEQGRTAPALGLPALQFFRKLLPRVEREQHGRPVQRARHRETSIAEWGNAARTPSIVSSAGFSPRRSGTSAVQLNINGNLGTAYGIQTGHDDNGDLIFNDRPAGVARNTLLTDPMLDLNMFAGLLVHVRAVDPAAARHAVRARRGRGADRHDLHAAGSGTLPDDDQRRREQPDEPDELAWDYSGVQTSPFYGSRPRRRGARRVHIEHEVQF